MLWNVSDLCRLLAVSHLALLAFVLLREHRRDPSCLASVFLIATSIAHQLTPVLAPLPVPTALFQAVLTLGFGVPFAFWLLAKTHFEDDFRLRPLHPLLFFVLVGVCWVSWHAAAGAGASATDHQAFWSVLPRLVGLAFVIHALIQVHVGARADLVVPRLRLRHIVLSLAGTYILLELVAEALLRDAARVGIADRVHAVSVLALVLVILALALRLRPDVLRPSRPPLDAPAAADPLLVERLVRMVEEQGAYREEGLTIAALAERLGAQEYRVRQLINDHLGFRNFNAFLHHYRIGEAQRALSDPARAHLGVAQIAYEVGYRSLGPFNKAFKEASGLTPSEYRAARRERPAPDLAKGSRPGAA